MVDVFGSQRFMVWTNMSVRIGLVLLVTFIVSGACWTVQGPAFHFIDAPGSPIDVDDAWTAVVEDFNQDGHLDIAVLCPLYYALFTEYVEGGSDAVSILLGRGDGSFEGPTVFPVGNGSWNAYSIAAGDFNGDGHIDLAVAGPGKDYRDPSIFILLNDGKGRFEAAQQRSFRVGREPSDIAVADFDLDGILDLAVACIWENCVSLLYGEGGGQFASEKRLRFPNGAQPCAIVTSDLNSDAWPDLIVAQQAADCVTVFLGEGDRRFEKAGEYAVAKRPEALACGDVDKDGDTDFVAANLATVVSLEPQITRTTLSLFLGGGSGDFIGPIDLASNGMDPMRLVMVDFDGDGLLDLATANGGSNDVSLWIGAGDGTFTGGTLAIIPGYPAYKHLGVRWVGAGDFNENGRVDLAILVSVREALFVKLNIKEERE
jgi:hypothetical protein